MGRSRVRRISLSLHSPLIKRSIFKIKEKPFQKLLSLIATQGRFIAEMSKVLATIVERIMEGSFVDSETFGVESVENTEILNYPKGSRKLLEMIFPIPQGQ